MDQEKLSQWKKDWTHMERFFRPDDISIIQDRLVGLEPEHTFFCSMENRDARSGGLAAVQKNMPSDSISPFHSRIMDRARVSSTGIEYSVEWGNDRVRVEILQSESPNGDGFRELYIGAPGFFEAENPNSDPYVHSDSARRDEFLLRDAMFFSKAVPAALSKLGFTKNIVLHLNEWQTALMSLTAKDAMLNGTLESIGTIQTMHNPFDSPVRVEDLEKLVSTPEMRGRITSKSDFWNAYSAMTAYGIGLGLVDAPITTVSDSFAVEFTDDPIHTEYFAPHLQGFLSKGVIGVNNGPFVPFSNQFPERGNHPIKEVAEIKLRNRNNLLEILEDYGPDERFGNLTYGGAPITFLPDDVPIFMMTGRLDPSQKGFDILLRALGKFEKGEVKTILTPLAVNKSDLDFFHQVAEELDGDLTVFPIRMEEGYMELQTGSTFGVMSSIYEAFGAAIEYMVNGTPVVARATGGLRNQVVHGSNGFLYLERAENYTLENIRSFFGHSSEVGKREGNEWSGDMVEALYQSLRIATNLYKNEDSREEYYKMILNGFKKAGEFEWKKARQQYFQVSKKIKVI